jgi:hypothetical protein
VVVAQDALTVSSGHRDSFGIDVCGFSRAYDELKGIGRILGEALFNGLCELLVLEYARDDGTNGGDVPVEVRVLEIWLVNFHFINRLNSNATTPGAQIFGSGV